MSRQKKKDLNKKHFFSYKKPTGRTADRILKITLPTAVVLVIMVINNKLSPLMAFFYFTGIVIFTTVIMIPLMKRIYSVTEYLKEMAEWDKKGEEILPSLNFPHGDKHEAAEIVRAINEVRNIWSERAQELEARTLSDAAVLDVLPDPLIMLDENGKINGANLSARNLLGANIREKKIDEVIKDDEFQRAVEDVLSKESKSREIQFSFGYPLVKTLRAKIEYLPWQSKGGAVALVSLTDVTKIMDLERIQADFVANASHELRTPLSVLSGFIETLQNAAKDDEQSRSEFLKIMSEQAGRMSELVENLLSLSKIELSKDAEEDVGEVSLLEVIERVKKQLIYKAQKKGMEIKIDYELDFPIIYGNSTQLYHVFNNLTDNAIKYGKKDTPITVSLKSRGDMLKVSVNNKGETAIPEDMISRLTERFFRLSEHKAQGISGSGLGLAIVKHVIDNHEGKLKITSSESEGTTFTVLLKKDFERKRKIKEEDLLEII